MTARALVRIDAEDLQAAAFKHDLHIERSADEQRMYVVWDGVEFWAPSPDVAEVTC